MSTGAHETQAIKEAHRRRDVERQRNHAEQRVIELEAALRRVETAAEDGRSSMWIREIARTPLKQEQDG